MASVRGEFIKLGGSSTIYAANMIREVFGTFNAESGDTVPIPNTMRDGDIYVRLTSIGGPSFVAWGASKVFNVLWAGGTWNMWVVTGLNSCYVSTDGVTWLNILIPNGSWYATAFNLSDNTLMAMDYVNGQYCFAEAA